MTAMLVNSLEVPAAGRSPVPAVPREQPAIHVTGVRKCYDGVVQGLDGDRKADGGDLRVLGFDPGRRERFMTTRSNSLELAPPDAASTAAAAIEASGEACRDQAA